MFAENTIKALSADLDRKHVRTRKQSGRSLSYIEGWHAIAEANRIFGFDGWERQTVEIKCVAEGPRDIGENKIPGFGVTYIAKVRVSVLTGASGHTVVREGCGTGHGIDRDLGQAHESALKEAETDAMKRALMTFGNPFGLALYDKEQANVSDCSTDEPRKTPPAQAKSQAPAASDAQAYVRTSIEAMGHLANEKALKNWWASEKANRERHRLDPDSGPGQKLMDAFVERKAQLQSELMGAG